MFKVEEVSKFACGVFLCHGICLLAAGFQDAGWLVPAYEEPECDLGWQGQSRCSGTSKGAKRTRCVFCHHYVTFAYRAC